MTTNDEIFYRELVFKMFENNSSERISNGDPVHAACILEAMFVYAEKSVKIFCERLSTLVFNRENLFNSLKRAIERGIDVEVITQEKPDDTPFYSFLEEKKLVKVTSNSDIKSLSANFAVMDNKAFRYEKDKNEIKAFACANDIASASILLNNFTLIKSIS